MSAQTIPDLFRQEKADWIREAQSKAVALLKTRYSITVEDVLAECPRPKYLHRNLTGNVFKNPVFKHLGFTKAKNPSSNSRIIGVWGLRDEFFSPSELRRG